MQVVCTGFVQWIGNELEHEPGDWGSHEGKMEFHDALYFTIVTFALVGYGDVAPRQVWGRVIMLFVICVAFIVLPVQVNILANKFRMKPGFSGGMRVSGKESHIVVCCDTTAAVGLQNFLLEFFHEDHGGVSAKVCVMMPGDPSLAVQELILRYKRVVYLRGDLSNNFDASRARCDVADAVFILADRTTPNPNEQDSQTVLRALNVRAFNPAATLFVQILEPRNQCHVAVAGVPVGNILCVGRTKLSMIGMSVQLPGVATMVMNLVKSTSQRAASKATDSGDLWRSEYADGLTQEIYYVDCPEAYMGMPFTTVVLQVYDEFDIVVFGLRVTDQRTKEAQVVLNPGAEYRIHPGDMCFIIAEDQQQIDKMLQAKSRFVSQAKGSKGASLEERDNEKRVFKAKFKDEEGAAIEQQLITQAQQREYKRNVGRVASFQQGFSKRLSRFMSRAKVEPSPSHSLYLDSESRPAATDGDGASASGDGDEATSPSARHEAAAATPTTPKTLSQLPAAAVAAVERDSKQVAFSDVAELAAYKAGKSRLLKRAYTSDVSDMMERRRQPLRISPVRTRSSQNRATFYGKRTLQFDQHGRGRGMLAGASSRLPWTRLRDALYVNVDADDKNTYRRRERLLSAVVSYLSATTTHVDPVTSCDTDALRADHFVQDIERCLNAMPAIPGRWKLQCSERPGQVIPRARTGTSTPGYMPRNSRTVEACRLDTVCGLLHGHVLVLCDNVHNGHYIVAPLRDPLLQPNDRPVVFLCAQQPTDIDWDDISEYSGVYVVIGEQTKLDDLMRAGIETAGTVLVMSDPSHGRSYSSSGDAEVIVTSLVIEAFGKNLRLISEMNTPALIAHLAHSNPLQNKPQGTRQRLIRRLTLQSITSGAANREAIDPEYLLNYSAGDVVLTPFLESLLCMGYFNPYIIAVANALLSSSFVTNESEAEEYSATARKNGEPAAASIFSSKAGIVSVAGRSATSSFDNDDVGTLTPATRTGRLSLDARHMSAEDLHELAYPTDEHRADYAGESKHGSPDAHRQQRKKLVSSRLTQVRVPDGCSGKPYGELFRALLEEEHSLAMGLLRAPDTHGQPLPYVVTNPPPDLIVGEDDAIFLLVPADRAMAMKSTSTGNVS